MRPYRAIDLFAGIGGIRLGFEQAFGSDIDFVFANEINRFACETYAANFGEDPFGDINEIKPQDVPDHEILLAGWPCQSFSLAGKKRGLHDARGNLFYAISKILEEKRPSAFLLENVAHLEKHDGGRTFSTISDVLEDELGYHVHHKILDAKFYGVPQSRPRIFIAGFSEDVQFEFPEPSSNIPKLSNILEKSADNRHYISQRYLKGLKKHRKRHEDKGHGFGYIVLDPNGAANALVIGGMGHERNLVKDVLPPNAYGGPGDELGKPNAEGLRRLTPKECARLQGFPDSFKFPVSMTQTYRQLAESVSVPLVERIALEVKESLENHHLTIQNGPACQTTLDG
ncbi:MAG: DNA (cytosine-5-)-methyltransferase [Thermoplasmata archaeon]|nr:DNA (cytosine-5-)-methyltransferase [Thermoplasmata archaeon]